MKALALFLVLIAFTVLNSGCTLLGIGAGVLIDDKYDQMRAVDKDSLHTIRIGREISVATTDSNRIIGRYMGTDTLPPDCRYAVESEMGMVYIPPDMISSVSLRPRHTKYWLLLGGIGFVIDAAITAAIMESLDEGLVEMGTY